MTLAQLEKRVRQWQVVLAPLGVSHFRIDSIEIMDDDDAHAETSVSDMYDTVSFRFERRSVDGTNGEVLDELIIHEWVHAAMRDLDYAVESGKRSWIHHEREGLVDRVARTIYAQHSEV